jgi:hypothetical protein
MRYWPSAFVMTKMDQSSPRSASWTAARVLALSAAAGFLVGAFVQPTWTDNVESAQVLAGVVVYPQRTPMYDYHTSVYSLTIQTAALLLWLGVPEWPLSVLCSGLQGALSFAAIALFAFAVSGRASIALVLPLLLLRLHGWSAAETTYLGMLHGHRYPNHFPNDMAIYGMIGLFSVLLIFALLAVGRVKSGAFLLGLMPGLHPGLALPALLGAAAAFVFAGGERKVWWRSGWRAGAVGLTVSAVGALIQVIFFWHAAESASPERVHAVMEAFLRSWDDHNFPVRGGERLAFFESEIYTAALGFVALTLGRSYLSRATRAVIAGLLVVCAASVVYTLLFSWRPELVPWRVQSLLVMRWLNLSSLAFPMLGLGLLGRLALERRNSAAAAVLVLLTGLMAMGFTRSLTSASVPWAEQVGPYDHHGFAFPVGLVLAVGVLLPLDRLRRMPRHGPRFAALLGAAMLTVGGAYLLFGPLSRIRSERLSGVDAFTPVLEAARGRPGLLLVARDLWEVGRPQTCTRRPLLIDPAQLNMLTKVPGSGPRMADILLRVFEIDLLQQGKQRVRGWINFDLEHWRQIRREFGVTDVLAHSFENLQLPVVFENDRLRLYAIPP